MKADLIGKYSTSNLGYTTLFRSSGTWKVAISKSDAKEDVLAVSRHFLTDESFVLIDGGGYLISAEIPESGKARFFVEKLKQGVVYNIPPEVWHAHRWDEKTSVLIIENTNTGSENSEEYILSADEKSLLMELLDGCSSPQ